MSLASAGPILPQPSGSNADSSQLSAAEMSAIAASFNDKSETKAVIANGVKVNGEKYMTIESTDEALKAKKVRQHTCHEINDAGRD